MFYLKPKQWNIVYHIPASQNKFHHLHILATILHLFHTFPDEKALIRRFTRILSMSVWRAPPPVAAHQESLRKYHNKSFHSSISIPPLGWSSFAARANSPRGLSCVQTTQHGALVVTLEQYSIMLHLPQKALRIILLVLGMLFMLKPSLMLPLVMLPILILCLGELVSPTIN